jgi:cell division protease FtsH
MLKNLVIWLVIGLVLMTVFNQFNTRQAARSPMEYSQFLEEVKAGRIAKVTIEGRQLKATTNEGKSVVSYSPGDIWLVSTCSSTASRWRPSPRKSLRCS